MKVAFVSGNREQLPDAVIPLGLLTVASNIPARHERLVIDLCFEDDPNEALTNALRDFAPDLVAVGMRNIQSADYSGTSDTIEYYAGLFDTIRKTTPAPIVLGGSGFSVMPHELMQRLHPDFGIAGEAEVSFPLLLDRLEHDGDLDDIGGLHHFMGKGRPALGSASTGRAKGRSLDSSEGLLISNPPSKQFLDMNTLVPADRTLVDPRHYAKVGIDAVQTKRGCPLRCEYCTYPVIEGRVGRLRDPSAVVDELQMIVDLHPETNHVFMVDSVFNLPRTHAKEVCREIITRGPKLRWTCYANPLGFDEELADLMAEAGCAGMEVGSDSGSNRILDKLRKGFTTDQIRELHRLAEDAGIPDCHTFLLGTPGETLEDVKETLEFIIDLDPFGAILMAWVDDYEALDPSLAKERQALRDTVLALLEQHKGDYPWWSIPSLGVNYDPALFDLLRSKGLTGPLWQHLRMVAAPPAEARRAPRTRRRRPGSAT